MHSGYFNPEATLCLFLGLGEGTFCLSLFFYPAYLCSVVVPSLPPPRTGDILAVRAKGYRVLGDGLAFIFIFALPQLAQPTNQPA